LGEAFLAFGGEQMCDQEFSIAQTRFGLLFDERVDVRFSEPGNGVGHQPETFHRQHAQSIQ